LLIDLSRLYREDSGSCRNGSSLLQILNSATTFRSATAWQSFQVSMPSAAVLSAALWEFWNGKELDMPLEIVIGTGMCP
jgi:hypothetical protein